MIEEPVIPPPVKRTINPQKLLIGGVVLLICLIVGISIGVGVFTGAFTRKTQQQNESAKKEVEARKNLPARSLIYAYWSADKSIVGISDLRSGKNSMVSTLPYNIKHMTFSAPESAVFIAETNDRDYGAALVMRNLKTEREISIKKADENYGIDDYAISNNGQFAATWELSIPSDQTSLIGGMSRLYRIDVASNKTTLIYSEEILPGKPIHYPLAISNSGELFIDTFSPNTGAGWAHGITIVGPDGVKNTIESMKNGTYSTQPVLSPDGARLLFIGYDGSKGEGSEVDKGFRRAFLYPNTIEVYDVLSGERTVVQASEGGEAFSSVQWEGNSNTFSYSKVSVDSALSGYYMKEISSGSITRIPTVESRYKYESSVGDGILLFGSQLADDSGLGNLAKKYDYIFTSLIAVNQSDGSSVQIPVGGKTVQLIGVVSSDIISDSLLARGVADDSLKLQLDTFNIKPLLAESRQRQQSEIPVPTNPPYTPETPQATPTPRPPSDQPRCYELAAAQCNAMLGTNYDTSRDNRHLAERNNNFNQCRIEQEFQNKSAGLCANSPLYVYGPKGTTLHVAVGTPIYRTNVPYLPEEGFSIQLMPENVLDVNGRGVESISFDYETAYRKAKRPAYGYYIKRSEIDATFAKMALKMGLNEKETIDTIKKASEVIVADYAFVSYYNNSISKKILPLIFTPQPDNYYNVVFYIENLDRIPLYSPNVNFPQESFTKRDGVTAVEISFIVK